MKNSFLLFCLIFLTCAAAFCSEKTSMAVYDFDAGQVDPGLANSVADFVQTGLNDTGRFNIVERKKMKSILKEQAFQKTGCSSTECAVEAGRLLNVSNIVTGTLAKTGNRYTLTINLVDVESGKILISDNVQTDSEDLMNTVATRLAEHFSKRVGIKGKILKINNDREAIVNLGSQDNIEKNQEMYIERLGEAVKDDSGKVVYQEKKKVAKFRAVEVMEEASKVSIIETYEGLKPQMGDIVEVQKEKLKPLDPILKGSASGNTDFEGNKSAKGKTLQNVPAEPSEESFDIFGYYNTATNFYLQSKTSSGTVTNKSNVGYVDAHPMVGFGFGGPVLTGAGKWVWDMGVQVGYEAISISDTTKTPYVDYSLMLMSDSLVMKFYPFTGLINPDFANYTTARAQRGAFAPYVGIAGTIYIGLFDYNTSYLSPDTMSFLLGFGADIRAGVEVGNIWFIEFVWRFIGSVDANYTKDHNGNTSYFSYLFDMNSFGFGTGFRF